MKKTRDAIEIIDSIYGGDAEWEQMVAEEELKARVGQAVYNLRTEAGLSQTRLAEMIGTKQPVISKLENADYDGSALEMLWRICVALRRRFEFRCPSPESGHDSCKIVSATA